MYSILFRGKYNKKRTYLLFLVMALCALTQAFSQEITASSDTLAIAPADSIVQVVDTIVAPAKKGMVDAVITYEAADSIVLFADGKGFLYGKGTVDYKNIQLQAEYIEMDMDNAEVYATGIKDSLGNEVGSPVFKDGGDSYEARTIKYNFNTKKGFIQHVVTQQGDGFVVSEQTKKTADDILFMKDGRYTTCSEHDHPHFYLNLTKAKVKPGSYIVTGPAYLVMEDVPLPLAIPFGYFPFTSSYSSGILMPSYGDELRRGFFLRDGGYYFAVNDYFDLALTGDIYTKGSWAVRGASSYVKRYKYRGSVNASYMTTIHSERKLPDFAKNQDFSIGWTHNQDPKANLHRTLSAGVNFKTSSYQRNNVATYNNPTLLSENVTSSSISLMQRIPNTPLSISATTTVNQRTRDSTINMTLPDLNVSLSRVFPFKRKVSIGKPRWYEKISMSYTGRFSNSITTKEDKFFHSSLKKDWQNGVRHSVPVSASFQLFKYLTITPSASYNARWYFSKVHQDWDFVAQQTVADTTYGFFHVHDYNIGVSMDTRVYGFFKPIPALFGNKINMIRWVLSPTVGFSMMPDFGAPSFGYWNTYTATYLDGTSRVVPYSHFSNSILGSPPRGKSGSLNFSLGNNLEMKVKSKNDSIGYKKISLIDNFSLSSSYNMAVDTMNWSNINANVRFKFTKSFGFSLSGAFDPYMYQWDERIKRPVKVNDYRWNHGKMPQLVGTSTSFGYAFNNQTFKRKEEGKTTEEEPETNLPETEETQTTSLLSPQREQQNLTDDGFVKFEIPWNFRFDYSLRYGRSGKFDEVKEQHKLSFSHNVSFSGDVSLTKKWRISFNAAYDITEDLITYTSLNITRDLHCWSMTASIVPIGLYTSYSFTIRVNSSLLQDLKYEQRSNSSPSVW